MFGRKSSKCESCSSNISDKYSFCPFCGKSLIDSAKNAKDYGLLGKNDHAPEENLNQFNLGITDKLIGSLMNSLMKNLDKQFKQANKDFENAEIKSLPNGIRIKIGAPQQQKKKQKSAFHKTVTDSQLKKMSSLPREEAKTTVKRLSDKVIYELSAPGIESPDDIFVSKLESGYEIKAIGEKKVYVNSLPVNLPLRSLSINNNKLLIEFATQHQNMF